MNIVGPSQMGATDLRSMKGKNPEKDLSNSGNDSFGKALEEKMSGDPMPDKTSKESLAEDRGVKKPDVPKKEAERSDQAEGPREKLTAQPEKKVALKKNESEKTKGEPSSRQQAIQEFMDSFESEFEIPPTRLVDAMAQLKDDELQLSPEETAAAVIQELDLNPDESARAQAMYVGLLAQLKQLEAPTEAPKAIVLPNQVNVLQPQAAQGRASAALQQQSAKASTVDRVNSQFWKKDQGIDQVLSQRLSVDESSFGKMSAEPHNLNLAPQSSPDALAALPPHLRGQMSESISPQLLAALAAKQAATTQAQENPEGLVPMEGEATEDGSAEAPALALGSELNAPKAGKNVESLMSSDSEFSQQFSQQQQDGSDLGQMQQKADGGAAKQVAQEKLTTKASEFKNSLTGLEGLQQPIKGETLSAQSFAAPVVTQAPVQTPADHEATVKNLMNQAQYLVKKGGGEVKVEMTPEGMGTIHLKLQVQDGKVSMQMSADTAEAKKTIETGLAELKTSLAAHKLSVDHVKVDVVNNTSAADSALQNQTNQQNGQRDSTRQFWNQFNENFGSQGRREGYTQEGVNLRGYGRNQAHDPLKPVETKAKSRAVEGKGSSLNLVA